MKVSNIIAVSGILAVSYMMYAMQPQQGAMREAKSLEQIAAASVARQIHDEKKTLFTYNGEQTRLDEFPEPMRKLIAEEYYRLYPEEVHREPGINNWRLVQEIRGNCNSIKALPDGSFVSAIQYNRGSEDRRVELWRPQDDGTFGVSQDIMTYRDTASIAVSPDGNLFAIGWALPIAVYARGADDRFVPLQNDILINQRTRNRARYALHNGPLGKTLILTYSARRRQSKLDIFSWSERSNSFELTQNVVLGDRDATYDSMSFNITGDRFIACKSGENDALHVWVRNQNTGIFVREHEEDTTADSPQQAIFSPDGRLIVIHAENRSNRDNLLIIKSISAEGRITEVQRVSLGKAWADRLTFSSDGQHLALRTESGIQVWSKTGNTFKRVMILPEEVINIALVGDNYLITVHGDDRIKIWELLWPSTEQIWGHILKCSEMPEQGWCNIQ